MKRQRLQLGKINQIAQLGAPRVLIKTKTSVAVVPVIPSIAKGHVFYVEKLEQTHLIWRQQPAVRVALSHLLAHPQTGDVVNP
jgi:hypothetical protein